MPVPYSNEWFAFSREPRDPLVAEMEYAAYLKWCGAPTEALDVMKTCLIMYERRLRGNDN